MSPRPSTSSTQPIIRAWLHLGISKSSTNSTHFRLFYSSDGVAPGKTQMGADLGLHHLRTPRPVYPVDSYGPHWSTNHPEPAQLILYRRRRLVDSGHSQSLHLSGLGKSLPLICQQLPRINYKRRVSSDHTKGATEIPSLGDRGGCATGPYRKPTTLEHTTKTWSQRSST